MPSHPIADKTADIVARVRDLLPDTDELDRARLADEILHEIYAYVRRTVPGGGLDGHDSDERASIGTITTAAVQHLDNVRHLRHHPPAQ